MDEVNNGVISQAEQESDNLLNNYLKNRKISKEVQDKIGNTADPVQAKSETPAETKLIDPLSGKEIQKKADVPEADKKTSDQPVSKKEESFKILKQELDAKSARLKALEEEVAEAREKYTTTEPKLKELEAKLEETKKESEKLTSYRDLFYLHENPVYKEKYIDRPNNMLNELYGYATGYGVSHEIINQAVNATNLATLDSVLAGSFKNDRMVTLLIPKIQELRKVLIEKAEQAKKPSEIIKSFREESEKRTYEQKQERSKQLDKMATWGWNEAEKAYKDLPTTKMFYTEVPGDEEHNALVREFTSKSKEVHTLVLEDLKAGNVEKISLEASKRLAAMSQKAIAFDLVNSQLQKFKEENSALVKKLESIQGIRSPRMNTKATENSSGSERQGPRGAQFYQDLLVQSEKEANQR